MSTSVSSTWTQGVAHVGLTVRNLELTVDLFVSTLGYKKLGKKPGYPAAFVPDSQMMTTLWQMWNVKWNSPRSWPSRHMMVRIPGSGIRVEFRTNG